MQLKICGALAPNGFNMSRAIGFFKKKKKKNFLTSQDGLRWKIVISLKFAYFMSGFVMKKKKIQKLKFVFE